MFESSFKTKLWSLVVVMLLSVWMLRGADVSEQGVTLHGYMKQLDLMLGDTNRIYTGSSCTNRFMYSLWRDGRWAMEVHSQCGENSEVSAVFMTFDGTDTYFVQYRQPIRYLDDGKGTNIDSRPFEQAVNKAHVCSSNYPYAYDDQSRRAQTLWLMLGAGDYLTRPSADSMPIPFLDPRINLKAYGWRVTHELAKGLPCFVKKMAFTRDPSLDKPDLDELARPELMGNGNETANVHFMNTLNERKAIPAGFEICNIAADGLTNYHGVEIPTVVTLKRFMPPHGNIRAQLLWMGVVEVTNVASLTSDSPAYPPILGTLKVVDERIRFQDANRKLDQIVYFVDSKGKWSSKNDKSVQQLFRAVVASESLSRRELPKKIRLRRIILTAFFVMATLSVSVAFYYTARKYKQN
jgi:hypothetical protein